MKVPLTLEAEEWLLVFAVVKKLPYEQAAPIIAEVDRQFEAFKAAIAPKPVEKELIYEQGPTSHGDLAEVIGESDAQAG